MKTRQVLLAMVLGAFGCAYGAALQEVYKTPGYVWGIYDRYSETRMSKVPTTPTLIFPGAALEEMLDCTFAGWAGAGAMNSVGDAMAYFTHPYYDADGVLQFVVTTIQKYDDKYVKGASIKLTQGAGGVMGEQIATPYYQTASSNLKTWDFVTVNDDGSLTWHWTQNGNYNFYCFNALKWVPVATKGLLFKNAPDEPTLTVDDLKNYRFTGVISGGSISPVKYTTVNAQNKYITYDPTTGKATKIRLEMQLMDDRFLKCPVVELTDGEGGVYGQTIAGLYVEISGNDAGVGIGFPFLNDDGSLSTGATIKGGFDTNKSDGPLVGGYGVGGLTAIATNERLYNLNASKTWSELSGSTEPISDTSLDIIVNVTSADATLTFDVPITANSIVVKSSEGCPITFALAEGVAEPAFGLWDTRGTTGQVTFTGFSPVMDEQAVNILPNKASMFRFNGETNGRLPFNNAPVALPCAGVILGNDAFINQFGYYRLPTLTVDGFATFYGQINGGGTMVFTENATFGVDHTVVAAAAKFTVPADVDVPVASVGEAPNTLTMNESQVTGGRLVLTSGTLTAGADSSQELYPYIGAGGTLAITVNDAYVRAGYTSPAKLLDGGTIRFYNAAGEEVGVGRPVMNVLPGTDALWAPRAEGENTFATHANWSTGTTPVSGDVAVTDGGAETEVAVMLSDAQGYGQVTVAQNAKIVFVGAGGLLNASKLVLSEGATVTIPLEAVSVSAVEVRAGATLVVTSDDEAERAFGAVVSGTGRVIYGRGKINATACSTYTGGTTIRPGVYVKNAYANRRTNVSGIGNCGAFGKMETTIIVEAGGTLDTNGNMDGNYYLNLAGDGVVRADGVSAGAYCNSGANCGSGQSQALGVTLSGSASIRVDEGHTLGFIGPGHANTITVNLGTNTLTKVGGGILYFSSKAQTTMSGSGTFRVAEGEVNVVWQEDKDKKTTTAGIQGGSSVLETLEGGTIVFPANGAFKTIKNNGTIKVITNGHDLSLTGAYQGDGEVIKQGTFSAWVPMNNGCKSVYTVEAGRLSVNTRTTVSGNAYAFNTEENPRANQRIVVLSGASYDLNGIIDFTPHVVVNGRLREDYPALTNRSGTDIDQGKAQVPQITVASEAWVGGLTKSHGLLAPGYKATLLELGTNTMHICCGTNTVNFWMVNTTVTGSGSVKVDKGVLYFHNTATTGKDWTLEVGPDGTANLQAACGVSNLVYRGAVVGPGSITATGTYLPASETLPKVVLTGTGAGIDVSERETAWDVNASGQLTFGVGTKVAVRTGERALKAGDQLIAWTGIPANVVDWTLDSPAYASKLKLSIRSDGIYVVPTAFSIFLR